MRSLMCVQARTDRRGGELCGFDVGNLFRNA